jgi:hypothetical protein
MAERKEIWSSIDGQKHFFELSARIQDLVLALKASPGDSLTEDKLTPGMQEALKEISDYWQRVPLLSGSLKLEKSETLSAEEPVPQAQVTTAFNEVLQALAQLSREQRNRVLNAVEVLLL